jgi:hypothetical protein
MKIVDYEDSRGIMRRVQLPDDETDPTLGIPIDFYDILEVILYKDAPEQFIKRFCNAMWQRGIIEPSDLNKRNAPELIMQAYRSALKFEAHTAIRSIQEFISHD